MTLIIKQWILHIILIFYCLLLVFFFKANVKKIFEGKCLSFKTKASGFGDNISAVLGDDNF